MRTQRNGTEGLDAAPVRPSCVGPLWQRPAYRPLAHVYRQGRLVPTPDRLRPVSTGFQRGSNSHRTIISDHHSLLHVVYLTGYILGQAGVSGVWFERAPSQCF
jgi:hypothetical protein